MTARVASVLMVLTAFLVIAQGVQAMTAQPTTAATAQPATAETQLKPGETATVSTDTKTGSVSTETKTVCDVKKNPRCGKICPLIVVDKPENFRCYRPDNGCTPPEGVKACSNEDTKKIVGNDTAKLSDPLKPAGDPGNFKTGSEIKNEDLIPQGYDKTTSEVVGSSYDEGGFNDVDYSSVGPQADPNLDENGFPKNDIETALQNAESLKKQAAELRAQGKNVELQWQFSSKDIASLKSISSFTDPGTGVTYGSNFESFLAPMLGGQGGFLSFDPNTAFNGFRTPLVPYTGNQFFDSLNAQTLNFFNSGGSVTTNAGTLSFEGGTPTITTTAGSPTHSVVQDLRSAGVPDISSFSGLQFQSPKDPLLLISPKTGAAFSVDPSTGKLVPLQGPDAKAPIKIDALDTPPTIEELTAIKFDDLADLELDTMLQDQDVFANVLDGAGGVDMFNVREANTATKGTPTFSNVIERWQREGNDAELRRAINLAVNDSNRAALEDLGAVDLLPDGTRAGITNVVLGDGETPTLMRADTTARPGSFAERVAGLTEGVSEYVQSSWESLQNGARGLVGLPPIEKPEVSELPPIGKVGVTVKAPDGRNLTISFDPNVSSEVAGKTVTLREVIEGASGTAGSTLATAEEVRAYAAEKGIDLTKFGVAAETVEAVDVFKSSNPQPRVRTLEQYQEIASRAAPGASFGSILSTAEAYPEIYDWRTNGLEHEGGGGRSGYVYSYGPDPSTTKSPDAVEVSFISGEEFRQVFGRNVPGAVSNPVGEIPRSFSPPIALGGSGTPTEAPVIVTSAETEPPRGVGEIPTGPIDIPESGLNLPPGPPQIIEDPSKESPVREAPPVVASNPPTTRGNQPTGNTTLPTPIASLGSAIAKGFLNAVGYVPQEPLPSNVPSWYGGGTSGGAAPSTGTAVPAAPPINTNPLPPQYADADTVPPSVMNAAAADPQKSILERVLEATTIVTPAVAGPRTGCTGNNCGGTTSGGQQGGSTQVAPAYTAQTTDPTTGKAYSCNGSANQCIESMRREVALDRAKAAGRVPAGAKLAKFKAQLKAGQSAPQSMPRSQVRSNGLNGVKNPNVAARTPTTDDFIANLRSKGLTVVDLRSEYAGRYSSRGGTGITTTFVHGDKANGGALLNHCKNTSKCYSMVIGDGKGGSGDGTVYILADMQAAPAHAAGANKFSYGLALASADYDGKERGNSTAAQEEATMKVLGAMVDDYGWVATSHGLSSKYSIGGRHECEGGCNITSRIRNGDIPPAQQTYYDIVDESGKVVATVPLPSSAIQPDGSVELAVDESGKPILRSSGGGGYPAYAVTPESLPRGTWNPETKRYELAPDQADSARRQPTITPQDDRTEAARAPQAAQPPSAPQSPQGGAPQQQGQAPTVQPPTQVQPTTQPIVQRFSCDPGVVLRQGTTTVSWACGNATGSTGTNFDARNATAGSVEVALPNEEGTVSYGVICNQGEAKSQLRTCEVAVVTPQIVIAVVPETVRPGNKARIGWTGKEVARCGLFGPSGLMVEKKGSVGVDTTDELEATTHYTVLCDTTVPGEQIQKTVTVAVSGYTGAVIDSVVTQLSVEAPVVNTTTTNTTQNDFSESESFDASGDTSIQDNNNQRGTFTATGDNGQAVSLCDPSVGIYQFTQCLMRNR